jgi:hypothetical protein
MYGFGDASKPAFGATIQIGDEIHYQYGQWSNEVVEDSSSNWRELGNLVHSLKFISKDHDIRGRKIFIFTDNSTAEAAFWKGTSKSEKLFDLVLELKELELDLGLMLHVIHVSGRRMIAQGTDGLSRADYSRGVMQGRAMTAYVPLHLSPLERKPDLRGWLEDITKSLDPMFLEPSGWYEEGHRTGTFVWTPPPAAAEVVVEQLGRARMKRPEAMHIAGNRFLPQAGLGGCVAARYVV